MVKFGFMKYQNFKLLTVFSLSTIAAFLFGWNAIISGPGAMIESSTMWNGYRAKPGNVFNGDREYDVLRYNIALKLDPAKKIIKSKVEITFVPCANLSELQFDLSSDMIVSGVKIKDKEVNFSRSGDILQLSNSFKKNDTVTISVVYSGDPSKKKNFFFGRINKIDLIYTLNEPENTRDWLVCNDTPSDKALVSIAITADTSLTSVSIGKLDSTVTISNTGERTAYWNSAVPLPTYLISFFSSRYQTGEATYISSTSGKSLPLYIYGLPWQRIKFAGILEDHKEFLRVFEKYFGEYPFPGEKYGVAAFLWQYGAMEYPTVSGFGSRLIDDYPAQQTVFVHELAHHWFGNSVSPKTWGDIWLNEGFASFCEWLYLEEQGKNEGRDLISKTLVYAKEPNALKGALIAPDDIFASRVYIKGAWVLRMLRNELEDKKFFEGLKEYYNTFKYRNASTEDLINVFERVSGRDLGLFFDQWIFSGEGVISLKCGDIQVEKRNGKYFVSVKTEQVQQENRAYNFLLDIKFSGEGKVEQRKARVTQKVQTLEFELGFKPEKYELDPDNFLLFRNVNDKEN